MPKPSTGKTSLLPPLSREAELAMQTIFISQGKMQRISHKETTDRINQEIEKIKASGFKIPKSIIYL